MGTIAEELTRIQNAKDDIRSSIIAKGVDVPTTSKIDEFSGFIDEIPSGGEQDIELIGSASAQQVGSSLLVSFLHNAKIKNLLFSGTKIATIATNAYYLENVEFINCNFSTITQIENGFRSCGLLKSVKFDLVTRSTMTNLKSIAGMFYGCLGLLNDTYLLSNFSYCNLQDISTAFGNCVGLRGTINLNLMGFDREHVVPFNLNSTFQGCSYITKIIMPNITRNYNASLYQAFKGCVRLTEIDFSGCNIQTNSLNYTFYGCNAIQRLDLSTLRGTVTNIGYAFQNCSSLTYLNISGIDISIATTTSFTNAFNGVKSNCEIIVKDDTCKTFMNTKFPAYTNVKTLAEYEGS